MTESVTGAAAPAALSWGRAAYDAYAEGLYTYCLSLLRDRHAAAASLRSTFVLADRHIGRLPDLEMLKPWLYALARYECLVRRDSLPATATGVPAVPRGAGAGSADGRGLWPSALNTPDGPCDPLGWPDAAALLPDAREALELAVRHRLGPRGVAAVLGLTEDTTRALLLDAGTRVDRVRAAASGVQASVSCQRGAALLPGRGGAAGQQLLLTHGEECGRCAPHVRLAAARLAPTTGDGAAPQPQPLLPPPSGLRAQVVGDVGRGRSAPRPVEPAGRATAFDTSGFPVFRPGGPVYGRSRRRATAVAVLVAAAVVLAPALALWQSARDGTPMSTPLARDSTISSAEVDTFAPMRPSGAPMPEDWRNHTQGGGGRMPEGTAGPRQPDGAGLTSSSPAAPDPDGRSNTDPAGAGSRPSRLLGGPGQPPPVTGDAAPDSPGNADGTRRSADGGQDETAQDQSGQPVVRAQHNRDRTLLRLTNTGSRPVAWTASTGASWLVLSHSSGTLAPGADDTVTVTVDSAKAPQGSWAAQIRIEPGGSVVTIQGSTGTSPTTTPPTTSTPTSTPTSDGPPSSAEPTPPASSSGARR